MVTILPAPTFAKKPLTKRKSIPKQKQVTVQKTNTITNKTKPQSSKQITKNTKPGFETIHNEYEPIITTDTTDVNELLKDLGIKAVRENRKIKGKTYTIIHERQKQETIGTTVLDDTVALYDKFIDECLLPLESKHPAAFHEIVLWVERFGDLRKKRKED
jgi:hypothetical protein